MKKRPNIGPGDTTTPLGGRDQGLTEVGVEEAAKSNGVDERDITREARIAENLRALAPIIADLRSHGVDVSDLDNTFPTSREVYLKAIPVLLSWLPRTENSAIRNAIIRTLTVPWARGVATRAVLDEFYR